MPVIYELFGKPLVISSEEDIQERKAGFCPFTKSRCDGGGNRNQTKIDLTKNQRLKNYFVQELSDIIPGICSIDYGNEIWIVCPRRLLGFKNEGKAIPDVNLSLQDYEKEILLAANLPININIGIWSEVYLQYGDNESNSQVDYHFDFIAAPVLENVSIQDIIDNFELDKEEDIKEVIQCARKSQLCEGKYSQDLKFKILPDLSRPVIFEVMTASTSGSNTKEGTNIASAFTNAILGQEHKTPGINKRQVWGRMATQLFSKSALAEIWGGEAYWIVQDQLLKNIERTTKLSLENVSTSDTANINFIALSYPSVSSTNQNIYISNLYKINAGLDFYGNNSATDILLPKQIPHKKELLKAMLRRKLAAVVNL